MARMRGILPPCSRADAPKLQDASPHKIARRRRLREVAIQRSASGRYNLGARAPAVLSRGDDALLFPH
ncbi:hypothetical protein E2562_030405 [Oryza meyeriana var. granulata]|uniref:Uncharacterized protein n=1 Tax=Oryza meyeriana var. granulata TaxID=110450 RepID=A0A6G1FDT9_9ORYZ|nr:hypothetical protein E2562_030405 [Oryza meyeriana var. granulata]